MKHLFLISAISLIIFGCTKEDTTPPTVDVTTPSEGQIYTTGDSIPFGATFLDNNAMFQYNITVETNDPVFEEDHLQDMLVPFDFIQTFELMNPEETVQYAVPIPVDVAAGDYTFTVYGTDEFGNDTEEKEIVITLQNASDQTLPDLVVSNLSETASNTATAGGTLLIDGTATDDAELGALQIRLVQLATGNVITHEVHNLSGATSSVNYSINIPATTGNYLLVLTLHDQVNNQVKKEFSVLVQ